MLPVTMFNKKTATRTILKNLARVGLAIILAALVVTFLGKQIAKTANSLTEKKKAAALLEKRSELIANLRTDLAVIGGNDAKIEQALPPDDNISTFLSTIQDLAGQNSVQQTIKIGTAAPSSINHDNTTLSQIDYLLTINGTVVTLIGYLKSLEGLPYFTYIKSISINAPSGWEGNSNISMSAQLYAKQTGQ